jgi:hypothetical protein
MQAKNLFPSRRVIGSDETELDTETGIFSQYDLFRSGDSNGEVTHDDVQGGEFPLYA